MLSERRELSHPSNLVYQVTVKGVGPVDGGGGGGGGGSNLRRLLSLAGDEVRLRFSDADGGSAEALCSERRLAEVTEAAAALTATGDRAEVTVVRTERHVAPGSGLGRKVEMEEAVTLRQAVEAVKAHCGVERIRVVVAVGKDLGETHSRGERKRKKK